MSYWKLGCRWGSKKDGLPLFLELLLKHNIVISWVDRDFAINSKIILTDGHTIIGIAETISSGISSSKFPDLKEEFDKYKIHFHPDLLIYKSKIFTIDLIDRFEYKLVQGICGINDPQIISQTEKLFKKYLKKMETENFINLLKYKYQIILQGPPGTGKTREAKLIAKEILGINSVEELNNNIQFKLIQFHPSYTYEDFVRGIVAISKGDRIEYRNVNKTLGLFAKEALKNFINSEKVPELISKENWVEENYLKFKEDLEQQLQEGGEIIIKEKTKPKITAIEEDALRVNRYSNEKDSILVKDTDIIEGYIGLNLINPSIKVKENVLLSKSARSGMYYLYQNLIEKFNHFLNLKNKKFELTEDLKPEVLKKFVLVIDEINRANLPSVLGELIYALEYRGEAVESMYAVDDDTKFILPPNLFIIGTMNTSDRSVGHIDYAIRRRFAFIDVLPKVLEIENFQVETFKSISSLFIKNFDAYLLDNNVVLEKSEYLSEEFNPKDVWLGHSYFISTDEEFEIRKKYEIKPILEEYVKDGILKKSAEAIINGL